MNPQIATLACFAGIAYLFWIDRKRPAGVSGAVWIPYFWMFLAGSRFASQWLSLGPPEAMTVEAYSEGSPVDRYVFLALVVSAFLVLLRRRLDWATIFRNNKWIFAFFLFAAISIAWSDDPFISFKRWVKGTGNLLIALVLLTEQRPQDAIAFLLRRLAYVLLPLSVLFIKYFPDLGRSYHMGKPMFTGVTFQKNSLGQLCMLLWIYFCWYVLVLRRTGPDVYRIPFIAQLAMYPTLVWLLYKAQSATALGIVFAATSILLLIRLPYFTRAPERIVSVTFTALPLLWLMNEFFGITDIAIRMLGREPDLTDRKPIWSFVLKMVENPWIGTGYENFWTGERMEKIWAHIGHIVQAHNGYIDLYLNLGIIGSFLMLMALLSGIWKLRDTLKTDFALSSLKLIFFVSALAYNYTEAAFTALNNVFVLLLFSIVSVSDADRRNGNRTPLATTNTKTASGPTSQTTLPERQGN